MKPLIEKPMIFLVAAAFAGLAPFLQVSALAADSTPETQALFLDAETERMIKNSDTPEPAASAESPVLKESPTALAVEKEFARLSQLKAQTTKKDRVVAGIYRRNGITEGDGLLKVAMSDGKITLKEAVEVGLANSIRLKALKKKVEVSRSKVSEAKRALFPTVQAVAEFNGGIVSDRFYRGKNQKLNVTQPVFYGGELMFTVKQAEATLKSTEEELKKAKGETIHDIRSAYYAAVKSEYNYQYQESLFKEAGDIHNRVRQEKAKSVVSEVDYLNVESQYNQALFQRESAKNDLVTAQLVFYQTLGVVADEPPPLDLRLDMKKVEPDLYEVLEKALRNNPEIRIKQQALEASEWGVKIYRAKKMPRVELRGSYGMLGEVFKDTIQIALDNQDLDTEKEWYLGANVSMPLGPNSIEYDQVKHVYGPTVLALTGSQDYRHRVAFNLFDRLGDITDEKSAEATYLQALDDLDKAKNELIVSVKEEYYNLKKALISIDSSVSKVRYQEKQNDILRYLTGLQESSAATLVEGLVEQAQNKYAFIQAVTDYHTAVSNLNIAMGEPDHFESKS